MHNANEFLPPDFTAGTHPIEHSLGIIHEELRAVLPKVSRMAFALYDPQTDRLKTFVHSTPAGNPLPHYEAALAQVPSLASLARDRRSRIIDDLAAMPASDRHHDRSMRRAGYGSSYTRPIFDGDRLFGFLFFDADEAGYFTPKAVRHLQIFVQLVTLALLVAVSPVKTLVSAVELASGLSRFRDHETGAHMGRMSRYARLIAKRLAAERILSDEFVEFVFMFAPLHDVGKIAIPDAVLLKRGPLNAAEFKVMQNHVVIGAQIIDRMVKVFAIGHNPHIPLLRNIVLHHHEAFDGSGYATGLAGEAIPLEARIVTVADIYDALTSERPYKEAWESERAFQFLTEQAGIKLDPHCVRALAKDRAEVEAIAARYRTTPEETAEHEGYFDWV
jgi:two-component system, response regulator RpfG